jgi:D-alanyl-D-alanine dipeptidase
MKWLINCEDVAIESAFDLPALNAPRSLVASGDVIDNGEPLVQLSEGFRLEPVYQWLGFKGASIVPRVREGMLERLQRASSSLPADFQLAIIDGHRTRAFQAELMDYYKRLSDEPIDGFVSDPYSTTVIPPHTTGGAVDLTLAWRGAVLGLGTDFDAFAPQSAPAWFENHSGPKIVRDLRRLLASVLTAEDIVPVDSEWWHWSYGDQWWAAQTGASAAIYGEVILPRSAFARSRSHFAALASCGLPHRGRQDLYHAESCLAAWLQKSCQRAVGPVQRQILSTNGTQELLGLSSVH